MTSRIQTFSAGLELLTRQGAGFQIMALMPI